MERLCSELKVGGKYKVRESGSGALVEGTEVEISGFGHSDFGVLSCTCKVSQFVKLKGYDPKQFHPSWIVNCSECSCYDPRVDSVWKAWEDRWKHSPVTETDPLAHWLNSEIDITKKQKQNCDKEGKETQEENREK